MGLCPSSYPCALVGMASGLCSPAQLLPDLLMALGDPSPILSATLTPLLRELLLKSSCPPPYQESRQVRELSICLFKEIVQMANWKHKRQMRKKVRKSLVPLVLHMSDEIESVAKVQIADLSSGAVKGVLSLGRGGGRLGIREGRRSWQRHFPHLPYMVQQGSAAAHEYQVPRGFTADPCRGPSFGPQALSTISPVLVSLCRRLTKPSV